MDEYFDQEDVFIVQAYMYESESNADTNESLSSSDSDEDFEPEIVEYHDERTTNIDWCACRNCSLMETGLECKCCHEFGELEEKLDGLQCITQHPGLIGNCIHRDVIEVSFYEFLQQNGPIGGEEPIHEYVPLDSATFIY